MRITNGVDLKGDYCANLLRGSAADIRKYYIYALIPIIDVE